MELIKKPISVCETLASGATQAMADGDVIVPDVKPDILKLLQVDADASVTDKYVENDRLIVIGRVDYKVLYIPDRENEKICSILTAMEFRAVMQADRAEQDDKTITQVNVERVEFSAVNSRKIRLRAVVGIDYEICRISELEICTDADDETIEKKKEKISFENTVDISEHNFTLKEVIEVPSGQPSIASLLKMDVKIFDTEYKTVTGKIIVKGNVGVCVLYTDDDGEVRYVESEQPFTEVFDADGVGEDTVCDLDYGIDNVMCEIHQDNDGDMRVAELDIDVTASVRATEGAETEVLSDCYVPYAVTECQTEKLRLNTTVERPQTQNTVREIIDFSQNAPGVSGVYNVMTNASVTKAELQRNKIICEGKIEAYILYLTDSAENPIYSLKKDIPFSYMLECECGGMKPEISIKAVIRHVSYSLNSSGGMELRCLLSIEGRLQKQTEIDNITAVETRTGDISSGIVIYFANEGESLWDIAKRYAVPKERIGRYNNLDDTDRLERSVKLFIPSVI